MEGLFELVIFKLVRQLSLDLHWCMRYCYLTFDGLMFSFLQFLECRLSEASGVSDMNLPSGAAVSGFMGVICGNIRSDTARVAARIGRKIKTPKNGFSAGCPWKRRPCGRRLDVVGDRLTPT